MRVPVRKLAWLFGVGCLAMPLAGQLPFYTDDPAVTERGKFHFEFFNELDSLQFQYPNLRQNTANYKLNVGLPHNLEVDVDAPHLAIFRAEGTPGSVGVGDFNLGVKWEFHKESHDSKLPALGVSLYVEFPTGDNNQQLGSGLTDYWLNWITQKSITDKTRVNANLGYLFAGNTSTGALGIQTALLTGDAKLVAQAIAQELGITDVVADLMPDHKRDRARALVAQGRVVAMVGDGINDACTGRALADSGCRIPHRGRVQLKWQRP